MVIFVRFTLLSCDLFQNIIDLNIFEKAELCTLFDIHFHVLSLHIFFINQHWTCSLESYLRHGRSWGSNAVIKLNNILKSVGVCCWLTLCSKINRLNQLAADEDRQMKTQLLDNNTTGVYGLTDGETERRWDRDLGSESEANSVSGRQKTELQIGLRGWSRSVLGAFLWCSSIKTPTFHLELQEQGKIGGKLEGWGHWKQDCVKWKCEARMKKVGAGRREQRFQWEIANRGLGGKENKGVWSHEVLGRRRGKEGGREQRAEGKGGGDWSATPLAALHNACGVIWCM